MKKSDAFKRWDDVEARNAAMFSIGTSFVYGTVNSAGLKNYGHYFARHVRKDELDDSIENMGFGLLPLLESRNDVAVFAWFERNFGEGVKELVDAIDDGKEFLDGVYQAFEEGAVGQHAPVPTSGSKKTIRQ